MRLGREISSSGSLVVFRNSQDQDAHGTLLHLTRDVAVFEVYNPYSIVQLSEVLKRFRVIRGDRTIYDGNAVISNLVPTGLMVIASATLLDSWVDLAGLTPRQGLKQELQQSLLEWESGSALRPSYQVAVGKARGFLGEMNRWLEQLDFGSGAATSPPPLDREVGLEALEALGPKLDELFGEFEHETKGVPADEVAAHKSFARRELHPFILRSPFVHRTYTKPLGYAGDYEMVNMMLRDPMEGPTTYARVVNSWFLRQSVAEAHQNRIEILVERLRSEASRVAERTLRCLNVGCGPAVEIERFVARDPASERCEFHLLDFNQETLEYTQRRIESGAHERGRHLNARFFHKSVNDLLRESVKRGRTSEPAAFDLVYCAGLFDYLSDRVCRNLIGLFHEWVAPGGLVLVTNVHPANPMRGVMEHILEWNLVYRDETAMTNLATDFADKSVMTDATGINVFLDIRKSAP